MPCHVTSGDPVMGLRQLRQNPCLPRPTDRKLTEPDERLWGDGLKRSELLGLSAMTDGWDWCGRAGGHGVPGRANFISDQARGASLLSNSNSSSLVRFHSGGRSTWTCIIHRVRVCGTGGGGGQLLCFLCVPSRFRQCLICFCASWTYRRGYHGLVCLVYLVWFLLFERIQTERGGTGQAKRQEGKGEQEDARMARCMCAGCVCCVCVLLSYHTPIPIALGVAHISCERQE